MVQQPVKKSITYGNHTLTLETGEIARQATAAVLASMGETVVLVTLVAEKEAPEQPRGFFPLTVNYQERTYAVGKVPGGYFKREGRPSENEVLVSRLIDRALRAMFPEGFENEMQVVATVLSMDSEVNPDILCLIAASAAVKLAGLPFMGTIAAARVGYRDGIYLINPTAKELAQSDLDLVVAGSASAVIMVESEAKELSERTMLGALMFGHSQMQSVIELINEFAAEAGAVSLDWQPPARNHVLDNKVQTVFGDAIKEAYTTHDKLERQNKLKKLREQAVKELFSPEQTVDAEEAVALIDENAVKESFEYFEKKIVRDRIVEGTMRIDGRDHKTVRPITIRTGVLPRTHGSTVFTRGETQAIVVATLGTKRDAQIIDALGGEYKEPFMLHYNFPPYSVGEIGMVGSPKRREIGHGRLARRALQAVLPSEQDFPYVLRVVSEITESNGSSSMATVCGASLALMDAGVPIKAPVAGVAMGLVKEKDRFTVLTDILGDEDHLGDMDFKVAGTEKGVTALQMDIKIDGITPEIMEVALEQALQGRLHILEIMNGVLRQPRDTVSEHAPRILTIKIDPEKIRDVIGKGGATIRAITEETGATIDINDEGMVTIAAVDKSAGEKALERVVNITTDVEVGQVYEGRVMRLMDFGAFVALSPLNKEGLLHVSQIAKERVERVEDYLQVGDTVRVKVMEIDRQGKIRLSAKVLLDDAGVTEAAVTDVNTEAFPNDSEVRSGSSSD